MTKRRKHPVGLRTRTRRDGSLRCWWEPNAAASKLGFPPVELDGTRLTWSARAAERINRDVAAARRGEDLNTARKRGRTIEDLVETYKRSRKFLRLSAGSKPGYLSNLQIISRKWGTALVTDFTKPVIYAWYETLHDTSGATTAIAVIRMFSILFAHAERIGWRAENSNPCRNLGMSVPKPRHQVFTWAQLDLLVATADKMGLRATGTAILLSALQGQRQTDVIKAGRDEFRLVPLTDATTGQARKAWVWIFTRSKRGNEGGMELHQDVIPRVRAALAANIDIDRLLIDELGGRPFTSDAIKHRWARVRTEAAKKDPTLAGMQFRDLRRTFGALARAAGASSEDIGDVLGNSAATNPRLGVTYMPPSFTTASRAVHALRRPETTEEKKA